MRRLLILRKRGTDPGEHGQCFDRWSGGDDHQQPRPGGLQFGLIQEGSNDVNAAFLN